MNQQAAVFEVPCHSCQMPGETRMCQTSIPYFSDLIIMSFNCEYCGAHSTQTKNSGEIKENASVMTLKVEGDIDLKRDLFKVYVILFRAKHVQSICQKYSFNLAMELQEECLQQSRASFKRLPIILNQAILLLIVILSSVQGYKFYFKIFPT